MTPFEYRTSTFCSGGECVEVGMLPEAVAVRDSKDRSQELRFSAQGWVGFIAEVKSGLHDQA